MSSPPNVTSYEVLLWQKSHLRFESYVVPILGYLGHYGNFRKLGPLIFFKFYSFIILAQGI